MALGTLVNRNSARRFEAPEYTRLSAAAARVWRFRRYACRKEPARDAGIGACH